MSVTARATSITILTMCSPVAIRVDLHNHSYYSYDSSNHWTDYAREHDRGQLDVVAITDHNRIEGALRFREVADWVIVGEEIDTSEGEIVGLFLERAIPVRLSMIEAAQAIREQGGLVYLQHPYFKFLRNPIGSPAIEQLVDQGLVDIVETCNGGPFMRRPNRRAGVFARDHGLPHGAGSDAHHPQDIGRCVVSLQIDGVPTRDELLASLPGGAIIDRRRNSIATLGSRAKYAVSERTARLAGGERTSRYPST